MTYMTIDDLICFLDKNNYEHLSLYDRDNSEIVVQMPGMINFNKKVSKHKEGLIAVNGSAYHDNVNLNKSTISKDVFVENTKSIKYRPFLANIVEDKNGVNDFGSHDFDIVTDEDGNESYVYYEKPIGVVTEYKIEYDEESKVNRANVKGYIFGDYCQDVVNILDRRKNTDVSVELHIRDLSYNAKEKTLILNDYYVSGVTFLGAALKPGMQGSNISLNELCVNDAEKCNFELATFDKLVETLEKLNTTISNFNINNANGKEDTQVNKFEELLAKYNKSIEDVTFEYEGLSDDELEQVFSEAFEESEPVTDPIIDPVTDPAEEPVTEQLDFNSREDVLNKLFELSHDELRTSLNVLCACYRTDTEWCYVSKVYDDYFVMEDWDNGKYYKQSYTRDEDIVSLIGERTELFAMLLTESEKLKVEDMRSNYEALKEKLDHYVKAEEDANKDALFLSDDYKGINTNEEFVALKENHVEFTLNELKDKLDGMLLYAAKTGTLNYVSEDKDNKDTTAVSQKQFSRISLPINDGPKKKSRYGSLF